MKRIYIFDVDNTIYSTKLEKLFPQTLQLLKKIKENPDYKLGYATGRGPAKMGIFSQEIKNLFDFQITVNGAYATEGEEVLIDLPIKIDDVKEVCDDASKYHISVGMVGKNDEAVTFMDEHVAYALDGYTSQKPTIDPYFYQTNQVYQLWIFRKDREQLLDIIKKYDKFQHFLWTYGGIDLIYPVISKKTAIEKIKLKYPDYQMICIGDGHNDIDMIKYADIGIAMGNSRLEAVKQAADYVAPHLEDDQLLDFFNQHQLV